MRKKRILFFTPTMRGGGAEKIISILLNYLNNDIYQLYLVMIEDDGIFSKNLPDHIKSIKLNHSRIRYSFLKILKIFYTIKPDLTFSIHGYLNLYLMLIKLFLPAKTKYICSEQTIASIHNRKMKNPELINLLYKFLYNKFNIIVCPSQYIKNDLTNNFSVMSSKIEIITNPIDIKKIETDSKLTDAILPQKKKNILAVGRLTKIKGFDLLIRAFSIINDDSYHLTILGDGEERESLEQLSWELNIKDRVSLPGFKKNPYPYMVQADLLVSCSEYEGFPNVILEANACGTPVLAIDYPSSIKEMIHDNINGYILKSRDPEIFAAAIMEYSKKNFDKEKITKLTIDRYSIEKVVLDYEALFEKV